MNLHYVGKRVKEDTTWRKGDERKEIESRADRGDGWRRSKDRAHAEQEKKQSKGRQG